MRQIIPETIPDYDATRIVERPDGFYWRDETAGKDYGPFPTLLEAVNDMRYSAESDYEPGETLQEAEAEIGVSEWIDPETGEPAEQPHRLEDH